VLNKLDLPSFHFEMHSRRVNFVCVELLHVARCIINIIYTVINNGSYKLRNYNAGRSRDVNINACMHVNGRAE
jgi:hypothetical protein